MEEKPKRPKPKTLPYKADESAPKPSIFWRQMGFLLTIYLGMLLFTIIAYPFSKQFIEPLMAFIFPIAEGNTLMKSVIIITVFYWVPAIIRLTIANKKS